MINSKMRNYDYYTYGSNNEYGQPELSQEVQGSIKIAIFTSSQSITENINYSNATYVGLTLSDINDKMVIQYGDMKLKVLYVNSEGTYKQIILGKL